MFRLHRSCRASRSQSTFSSVANSGLNTANLRNLGSLRSLALINGGRVVNVVTKKRFEGIQVGLEYAPSFEPHQKASP